MIYANRHCLDQRIVVRVARISAMEAFPVSLDTYLSPQDQERAARFRFPEDRQRFTLGRALLGHGLSEYWGQPRQPLELAFTSQGRPILSRAPEVQFSISHSHDLVAVALSIQTLVGVDLEYLKADFQVHELAGRIFSDADLKIFEALPEKEAGRAFFQAWTGKEAYLKARGMGIAEGLKDVPVPLQTTESSSQTLDLPDENGARPWRLEALPLPADYIGNVAWNDPQKCLDFCVIGTDINPAPLHK